ncbi:S-adenosyl-L-methionine-dependent methyltransferase [Lentithecium fluviatile CBS 122367]|uniref:S-adenosyl-L-methionine-dependent methyltransferase n=1 Tax=Lentithecium fluviatile CBS 122367 TaxID=1168545 RepID=A0A6G1J7S4_9PLEO|nr:S-adenosyl-L-methionine-dependent methyltransferase [Lentithecium fluviatile CBS 122367]
MTPFSNKQANSLSKAGLLALADNIAVKTKDIVEFLETNGLPELTFAPNSPNLPAGPECSELYSSLKAPLEDLQHLVGGPRRFWRAFCVEGYDLAAVQVALDFGFFTVVPPQGEIALSDLASGASLDLDRTSRTVRLMITLGIFQEPKPGFISHNATSHALYKDEELRCTVHYSLDEMMKAASATADSLKASPYEADSVHCAFNKHHDIPIFDYYTKYPERGGRFAKAMAGATKSNFDWAKLQGTVVDVGGGSGLISIALARIFPDLKFVVQDRAHMLVEGEKLLGSDVGDRVSFMQQSFFEPQPFTDVAAFLMRQCTHNWCDRDVVTMFKSIVPGLEGCKPGTPFLVNDIIMPEPGTTPRLAERELRQIDMIMLVAFGAKQRTKAEFAALLNKADPRYKILSVWGEGKPLGLLEVHLEQ